MQGPSPLNSLGTLIYVLDLLRREPRGRAAMYHIPGSCLLLCLAALDGFLGLFHGDSKNYMHIYISLYSNSSTKTNSLAFHSSPERWDFTIFMDQFYKGRH